MLNGFCCCFVLVKVEAADVAFEGDAKVLLTVQRADPEVYTVCVCVCVSVSVSVCVCVCVLRASVLSGMRDCMCMLVLPF